MFLSKTCEYALQAISYIAKNGSNGYVSVKEISEKTDIYYHFLGKIIQKLTRSGILKSSRGAKGGIALKKSLEKISLRDIIESVDEFDLDNKCIVGLPNCNPKNPCIMHKDWIHIREKIIKSFDKNIAQVLKGHNK